MHFVPCPSCARHVKSSEATCPFCSATLSGQTISRTPAARRRLERLAAFTFAASIAVTGCAVTGDDDSEKTEQDLGGIHAMYGMPPPHDAGPAPDAAPPPPTDAGPPCTPIPASDDNGGGFAAMYGMPPPGPIHPCPAPVDAGPGPVDAGPEPFDGGGPHAMYGMPPPPH